MCEVSRLPPLLLPGAHITVSELCNSPVLPEPEAFQRSCPGLGLQAIHWRTWDKGRNRGACASPAVSALGQHKAPLLPLPPPLEAQADP